MTGFPKSVVTDTECACGHLPDEHQHLTGRCAGQCQDPNYGRYNCVCPYYTQEKL